MRKAIHRLNTGTTQKPKGIRPTKLISGTYENTTEVEAVPNNRQFEKIKTGHIHKINQTIFQVQFTKNT